MNKRKYRRRYKKRNYKGRGLLGRDRWSWTPLYFSKNKQKGGFFQLLAVPYLAKLMSQM